MLCDILLFAPPDRGVELEVCAVRLSDLRPGMEGIRLVVKVVSLDEPREVTTYSGLTHKIVDGLVEDETGTMELTVWNEKIEDVKTVVAGSVVEISNCFITYFKGVLIVNIGRDSEITSK
jgi:replication factor A1